MKKNSNIKYQISNLELKSQNYFNSKFKIYLLVLSFAICVLSFAPKVFGASGINKQINFQGKLTNSDGTNVADNTYTVVFSLYNSSSGGSAVWTETDSVTTVSGVFQVALGANTSLAGFDFNQNTWYLGIKVNSDAEMTPRVLFSAVPYAFNADKLDGIVATNSATLFTLSGGTSGLQTLTVNGNITIGSTITPTSAGALTVQSNGANGLTLDTGGAATVSIGGANASSITFGKSGGTVTLPGFATNNNSVLYTGASGALAAATTSSTGLCLTSNGTGAAPTWATCPGGGSSTLQQAYNLGQTIDLSQAGVNAGLTIGTNAGNGNVIIAPNAGGQAALVINDQGSGAILTASASGTTVFTVGQTGSVTINNSSSTDIVKSTSGTNSTSTDYNYTANGTTATLTNLNDSNGMLALSNGTVPNSGTGNISSGATVNAAIGAGALTISRTDGKYLLIRGGSTTGTAIYDSYANTFVASTATTANVGAGALALPRPDGKYELILGGATATRNTIDPLMNTAPAAESGSNFCTSATSGTAAYRRLNGKFLVTCGGLGTTSIFDPVAVSWAAGPSATSGTWGAGSLVLPRTDGQALIIQGGATNTTQLYDPYNGSNAIGSFTAGPTLPTGCEMNGTGSVAIQLPNYTYLILSKANVSTIYDPTAGTFGSCSASGPSTALADGAHAIPIQNGKYLIIVGSGSTKAIVYDPTAGTFTDHTTTLNTVGAGAHSFMRPDGTWEIMDGGGTATNVFNTGLPMTGQYISEDINNTSLNITSTAIFDTGAQNTVTGQIGQPSNAESGVDFNVRTASSQSNLATATDKTIQKSGDLFYAGSSDSWIRITVNFTRRIPQDIMDDRGTWTGNSKTTFLRDYQVPLLKELTIDNSTLLRNTSFDYTNPQPSNPNAPGPTLTRLQGINDQLILPPGVLTETTQVGTTGFYQGKPGPHNPLPQITADGTIVFERPDKSFGIIATGSANFAWYDGATATFSAQTGAGNIPTANTGAGAFAIKLPGEKYLIVMGGGTTTTNIYNPYATSGNYFTAGPTLSAAAGIGATAILNADNTYTIIHGGGATTTSVLDPVGNQGPGTLPAGPTLTVAANCGFFALPMAAPNSYQYTVFPGVGQSVTGIRTGLNYDAKAKVFTTNNTSFWPAALGCGAYAFQRQDGYWLAVSGAGGTNGAPATNTAIWNPIANTTAAGPALTSAAGRGSFVIPRADGTFLISMGQSGTNVAQTTTTIYFPWGSTFGVGAGIGTMTAGPALNDGAGSGALAFWRPDGKFVIINGGPTGSTTVDTYDAGWYADGQYLSGQNNVSQLSGNSTLTWSQTSDKYVGVQVRTASSQAGLYTSAWRSIANSGGNLNINPGDTWVQVAINMSRDFPIYASIIANSDSATVSEGGAYVYPAIAMPAVNWYKISNDSDILTLQSGGSNVFRISSTGNVYVGNNGGYYSSGADLAERYTSTQTLQPGEVVTNDPANNASVMKSVGQYQQNLLGVVSTDPGFVAGAYTTDSYPIALAGRVPVLISTENGIIHAGDYLTSASIPGYAMKATVAGPVIGKAMEDFNPSNAASCPQQALGNLSTTQCGSIMMFVNLTNSLGTPVNLPDMSLPASQAALSFLENMRDQEASSGAYLSQITTDKLVASGIIIAPTMVADTLYAKHIVADSIDGLSDLQTTVATLSARVSSLEMLLENPLSTQSSVLGIASSSTLSLNTSDSSSATISGDLRIKQNALVEGILNVVDTVTTQNSIVSQLATFLGDSVFHGNVTILGHQLVGPDNAGVIIIAKNTDHTDIIFTKPYNQTPVITVSTMSNDPQSFFQNGYTYVVANASTKGFTIVLNKSALSDMQFAWVAVQGSN